MHGLPNGLAYAIYYFYSTRSGLGSLVRSATRIVSPAGGTDYGRFLSLIRGA